MTLIKDQLLKAIRNTARHNHPIRTSDIIGTHNNTIYNADHLFRRFKLLEQIEAPLLTSESVLSEVCFLIGRTGNDASVVLEFLSRGMISIGLSFRHLQELRDLGLPVSAGTETGWIAHPCSAV